MRNLRQRLCAFVAATMLAIVFGGVTPAYADIGTMGGKAKNTCAFAAGLLLKVPADSGAAEMLKALLAGFDCD